MTPDAILSRAHALDAGDPLASYRAAFVDDASVVAYLDGNSLGRPLRATRAHLVDFIDGEWGGRLIRAWDELWMERPFALGDRLGRTVLGAGEGQTFIGDSTTVLLYKLIHAAVSARPGRAEIVTDTENFPTDRYVVESVAAEKGLTIRWIEPDAAAGVTLAEIERVLSERTALVVLSHVAYKSAFIADMPGITAAVQGAGALVLWDLCHAAGVVGLSLDADAVGLAVGCTYKFLNGGPGSPAFGYVATQLQDELLQPIAGWMGHARPFEMGPDYAPAAGLRRFISGTPPILGMVPLMDMLDLIEQATVPAIRAKSVLLTEFAVEAADAILAPLGVTLASPRDPKVRGGHIALEHPRMSQVVAALWEQDIIPDFRRPQGLRLGLSPLSTSFAEVGTALTRIQALLESA